MSDEESRRAFLHAVRTLMPAKSVTRIGGDNEYIDPAVEARWAFWEAAVEWATAKEREWRGLAEKPE